MKIYTKGGDTGETSLYGGRRVPKDAARIQTLGTVDELNAALGVAAALLHDCESEGIVARLQSELFALGADLASPLDREAVVPRMKPSETARLEAEIDQFESELRPLRHFILPGGVSGGAALHMARAICRRAERHLVTLQSSEEINPEVARYVNRLSDHLFVLARLVNQRAGVPETIWERTPKNPEAEKELS